MSLKINHIALVVEDMEKALTFWRDGLGMELQEVEEVPEQEARVAFLPIGESHVELVNPTTATSGMAKYLAKRGPGMHHVCVQVPDIAAALERLKARNLRLIDEAPRQRGDRKYAFIHPESTHGVLVELYELAGEH
jgi:methylmalonyl-CoA/ethylmalonyl-CoA epimerase